MQRFRFEQLTLEFDLGGHHFRTDPIDLTASELPDPASQQSTDAPIHASASRLLHSGTPPLRLSLRKGLGFWHLTIDGQEVIIKQSRGIFYVAWLLEHPDQTPIHALDLMAKIPEIYRRHLGLAELPHPDSAQHSTLPSHARLQERSLSVDDAQVMRSLLRKQRELEAILDEPNESEPVKAEALRDLEAIAQFERQHARRTVSNAQRAADAVHKSITRFHHHLARAKDAHGHPHPVLTAFATYIEKTILIPSRRYAGHGNRFARTGLAGCLVCELLVISPSSGRANP